jgi:hypothetical protein
MSVYGNGPWKEGRATAVSLCYIGLTPAQLAIVTANHFRVGIRATLVSREANTELAGRNWDVVLPEQVADAGTLVADVTGLRERMEAACRSGSWTIWRLDGEAVNSLGAQGHAALLDWLGQEHARIWCAPIHDISQFRTSTKE